MEAIAEFEVTEWDQDSYGEAEAGPQLARAVVRKQYRGEIAGVGTAQLLLCQADPEDVSAGAGYVASEQVVGELGERQGSFVIQHWGISGDRAGERTAGFVVPGSGTGELAGLLGEIEISVDDDGTHRLVLQYEL